MDIALSLTSTETLNSLGCSLVKCPCEFALSRFVGESYAWERFPLENVLHLKEHSQHADADWI